MVPHPKWYGFVPVPYLPLLFSWIRTFFAGQLGMIRVSIQETLLEHSILGKAQKVWCQCTAFNILAMIGVNSVLKMYRTYVHKYRTIFGIWDRLVIN